MPVPEAGADSQASALAAASAVIEAFARPDMDYRDWIDALYPLLTQDGATAYQDTDPAVIPARAVSGTGAVLPGSTEVALVVRIPTDAGPYTVSLSRTGPDAPWLADRIRPAQD